MTEMELYEILVENGDARIIMETYKAGQKVYKRQYALATVAKDIVRGEEWPGKSFKAGEKVRITLASRMGDLGITGNLSQKYGYQTRGLTPGEGYLTDIEIHSFEEDIS